MAPSNSALAIARQVISIAQLEGNEELLMTLVYGNRSDTVERLLDVTNTGLADQQQIEELAGQLGEGT